MTIKKYQWIPILKTFISCFPMIITHAKEVFSVIKEVFSEENQRELQRIKEEAKIIKEQLNNVNNANA